MFISLMNGYQADASFLRDIMHHGGMEQPRRVSGTHCLAQYKRGSTLMQQFCAERGWSRCLVAPGHTLNCVDISLKYSKTRSPHAIAFSSVPDRHDVLS